MDGLIKMEGPADPERCQCVTKAGQCFYKAIPGRVYCQIHDRAYKATIKKEQIRRYNLTKLQARFEKQAGHPDVKNLRDEIGILRMMLETILNQCHSDVDLLINSHKIGDLVVKIEKLVTSCHRLDERMMGVLDKKTLAQFAAEVIDVITSCVVDPDALDEIANGIEEALARATDPQIGTAT